MLVVSNTSPISNLAIIGRLDLLQRRYAEIRVPPEVARELSALSHPGARADIQSAFAQGWLRVEKPARQPLLPMPLDLGESAAIALAVAARAKGSVPEILIFPKDPHDWRSHSRTHAAA